MIGAISTAISGLFAASKRAEASAENIANALTSGALDEKEGPAPYSAQTTIQQTGETGGVRAENIPKDPGYVAAYSPDSPFANEDGLIAVPNTDLAEDAVNLKIAEKAYKANLATIKTANEMNDELLRVLDDEA